MLRTRPIRELARRAPTALPAFALGITVLLWASAFVGIRYVGADYSPGSLAFGRIALAAVVLTAFMPLRRGADGRRRRITLPRGRSAVLVASYGVAWFGAYFVVLNWAELSLDAGTAALLVNVAPLIVAGVAGVVLAEGYPRPLLIGMAIAFAGVVVIALGGTGTHATPLGIALGLLSALLYAAGVLLQKLSLTRVDANTGTWLGCLTGAVVLLPFAPRFVEELGEASTGATLALVYLALAPTALAFTTFAYALSRLPAGRTTAATLAAPAVTILLSWALLGELPTIAALGGGALCLAGVAIARRR